MIANWKCERETSWTFEAEAGKLQFSGSFDGSRSAAGLTVKIRSSLGPTGSWRLGQYTQVPEGTTIPGETYARFSDLIDNRTLKSKRSLEWLTTIRICPVWGPANSDVGLRDSPVHRPTAATRFWLEWIWSIQTDTLHMEPLTEWGFQPLRSTPVAPDATRDSGGELESPTLASAARAQLASSTTWERVFLPLSADASEVPAVSPVASGPAAHQPSYLRWKQGGLSGILMAQPTDLNRYYVPQAAGEGTEGGHISLQASALEKGVIRRFRVAWAVAERGDEAGLAELAAAFLNSRLPLSH